jgi:hypothetical protein
MAQICTPYITAVVRFTDLLPYISRIVGGLAFVDILLCCPPDSGTNTLLS